MKLFLPRDRRLVEVVNPRAWNIESREFSSLWAIAEMNYQLYHGFNPSESDKDERDLTERYYFYLLGCAEL